MSVARLSESMRGLLASSVASALNGGALRIYTGALPASPDSPVTGSLLWEASPIGATADGPDVAIDIGAPTTQASGAAGYYRLTAADGTPRQDGPCWLSDDPAAPDGALKLPTLTLGLNMTIDGALTIAIPQSRSHDQ